MCAVVGDATAMSLLFWFESFNQVNERSELTKIWMRNIKPLYFR